MAGLQRTRSTGRAAGRTDSRPVQQQKEALPLYSFKRPGSKIPGAQSPPPLIRLWGILLRPSSKRCRMAATRSISVSMVLMAVSSAAAIPAMAGRFSGSGARFPLFLSAALYEAVEPEPPACVEHTNASGPMEFMGRQAQHVRLLHVKGNMARRLYRIRVKGLPRALQMAPSSPIGWMVPSSLFTVMTVTSAVSSRMAASNSSGAHARLHGHPDRSRNSPYLPAFSGYAAPHGAQRQR